MTTNRALTLSLEPSDVGEPIAGSLRDERGDEHRFTGWLGLLTLLEQAQPRGANEPELAAADAASGTVPGGEGDA